MTDPGEEAYSEFVATRYAALHRTAFVLTGSAEDADDLVQTALMKAAGVWRRIEARPEPYVRRIMYHENVSRWRRRGLREAALEGHDVPMPDHATGTADRVAVAEALARLTPKQRTVLVLRYFEDLSEQETAAAMGIRVGTVKSQTRHALMRLRQLAPELVMREGDPADV